MNQVTDVAQGSKALVALPPPPLPAISDDRIVVDELVMPDDSRFGNYNMAHIRISYTNRKRFNLPALTELSESIKAIGVVQPILIRPVTPISIASSLPRSVIDQVARAAAYSFEVQEAA